MFQTEVERLHLFDPLHDLGKHFIGRRQRLWSSGAIPIVPAAAANRQH